MKSFSPYAALLGCIVLLFTGCTTLKRTAVNRLGKAL
jgi:hypothetical protein